MKREAVIRRPARWRAGLAIAKRAAAARKRRADRERKRQC
jgi:hypothetical protein